MKRKRDLSARPHWKSQGQIPPVVIESPAKLIAARQKRSPDCCNRACPLPCGSRQDRRLVHRARSDPGIALEQRLHTGAAQPFDFESLAEQFVGRRNGHDHVADGPQPNEQRALPTHGSSLPPPTTPDPAARWASPNRPLAAHPPRQCPTCRRSPAPRCTPPECSCGSC